MKLQKVLKGRSPEASPVLTACSGPPEVGATVSTNNSLDNIECPTISDVLFGRGKPFQSHPGNTRLHRIVDLYKSKYSRARRHEKTEIAEEIVQIIKRGGGDMGSTAITNATMPPMGRFLKRLDDDNGWVEVSDTVAREKVSHALRGTNKPTTKVQPREEKLLPSSRPSLTPSSRSFSDMNGQLEKNPMVEDVLVIANKKRSALEETANYIEQAKKRRIQEMRELDLLLRQQTQKCSGTLHQSMMGTTAAGGFLFGVLQQNFEQIPSTTPSNNYRQTMIDSPTRALLALLTTGQPKEVTSDILQMIGTQTGTVPNFQSHQSIGFPTGLY